MDSLFENVVARTDTTISSARALLQWQSPFDRKIGHRDPLESGPTNLLTTNDPTETKQTTRYADRIAGVWERSPEAESEYHPHQNAEADRQFDIALEQDQKKMSKNRKKLQKKMKTPVHKSF